jgi:hypothetical protein
MSCVARAAACNFVFRKLPLFNSWLNTGVSENELWQESEFLTSHND